MIPPETFTLRVTEVLPPAPSVKAKVTPRTPLTTELLVPRKVILRTSCWTAATEALPLKLTTSGVEPLPPVKVPILVPAKKTSVPKTLI